VVAGLTACVLVPIAIVSPFEARETVVPPTVTVPPGVNVVEPMTKPDAELAVMVELPIVTTAGAVVLVEGLPPAAGALDEAPVPGSAPPRDVDVPVPGLTATEDDDWPGSPLATGLDEVPGATATGDVDVAGSTGLELAVD
jgi:hypothetical protein